MSERVHPTIAAMFAEVRRTGADIMVGVLTPQEQEDAQKYAFLSGYLHGCTHLLPENSEEQRAITMAAILTDLKRLRTVGEYRRYRKTLVEGRLHAP